MRSFNNLRLSLLFLLFASLTIGAKAYQLGFDDNFHIENINVDLGTHNGGPIVELTEEELLEYEILDYYDRVRLILDGSSRVDLTQHLKVSTSITASAQAPWVRLAFGRVNLGANSFVIITSHFDGDKQYHDAKSIAEWDNHSAYFKGQGVDIDLYVAPGDNGVQLSVNNLIVGEFMGGQPVEMRSQCGPTDDRVQSSSPQRDGRTGCTAWSTAAGFYHTAGHCGISNSTIMHFRVPASLCDGTLQPATANNQYPCNTTGMQSRDGGTGRDWRVFNVGANSNTGRTPIQQERAFYHITSAHTPGSGNSIMIRGYGTDEVPLGCTNFRNADNQTLQFHSGPSNGETTVATDNIRWEYRPDTEGGNSGSAVQTNDLVFHTVGIHTHAGCNNTNPVTGWNQGTSFKASDLSTAMNNFFGTGRSEWVDKNNHRVETLLGQISSTGHPLYPHASVQKACNEANTASPNVENIIIAGEGGRGDGNYAHTFSYSGMTNGVLLRNVGGAVRIGPNASRSEQGYAEIDPDAMHHFNEEILAKENLGVKVYPNPVENQLTMEFDLPKAEQISLTVKNALGQEVRSFFLNKDYDAGQHRITLDMGTLEQGIYFTELRIGNETKVNRIVKLNQ